MQTPNKTNGIRARNLHPHFPRPTTSPVGPASVGRRFRPPQKKKKPQNTPSHSYRVACRCHCCRGRCVHPCTVHLTSAGHVSRARCDGTRNPPGTPRSTWRKLGKKKPPHPLRGKGTTQVALVSTGERTEATYVLAPRRSANN